MPIAWVLLDGFHARHIIVDAACDSGPIRSQIVTSGGWPCSRPATTRSGKKRYDRKPYKHRHVIERSFRRFEQRSRIATRDEKKAANFAVFTWLAAGLTIMT